MGLTFQLHLDAVVLVIAAILLWLRGYWKPHWGGVALGALITFGALIPYLFEVLQHPHILPGVGGHSVVGSNFIKVWPVLKGILYWLRYSSLSLATNLLDFDFTPGFGHWGNAILAPLSFGLSRVMGPATVVVPLLANVWLWHRQYTRTGPAPADRSGSRTWLSGYAIWLFTACIIANALSPEVVMWWHNLIAFHAAVLPLVLWGDTLLRTRFASVVRKGMWVYLLLSVVLLLGMGFGRNKLTPRVRDSAKYHRRHGPVIIDGLALQMLRDLRLDECCSASALIWRHKTNSWERKREYFYSEYLRPSTTPFPEDDHSN